MQFDWDAANIDHLARHGVTPMEAEESIVDPLAQEAGLSVVDNEVRYRQIGATMAGRLLIVAYTMRGEAIRDTSGHRFQSNPVRSTAVSLRRRGMIPDKITVPKFATEAEEADWWYDNREEHGKIMAKAMREGRTGKNFVTRMRESGIEVPDRERSAVTTA